ncbi:Maf family protein [Granulosicoccus antarcticus]|uniref:7-methyl-GTP pyrophosphatase n=1 Tax=Granulosicoccus antarcticus IMCC3135 TaxID=1192854 RepID=A0A2Z2NT46_9GAMM|nr:Maf family nucleotide pyrophosphatase [Granulosicoccus antarcticus]ASJ74443.1 Maf-like protein YceF [Granulosicoccus antarcticus IMCC3135]
MQVLVLASGSRYRAELLQRLKLPFSQLSPDIDETATPGEPPAALATRLAGAKAAAARSLTSEPAIIIASDQVAALNFERLRKPGSVELARAQINKMNGQYVDFFTALCLLDTTTGHQFTALDHTRARLRELSEAEITRYIDADLPLDCAGSFKVESLGISLFDSVDSSDPTALIGLPLIALCKGLRTFGFSLP